MLLTLHTNAVRSLVRPARGEPTLDLADLPRFAREEFGLFGLNLTTDLLAGAVRSRLEKIRESADKAGCACLVLIEADALPLADPDDDKALGGIERVERVIRAAQILGCNSIAFRISGKGDDESLERAVEHLKEATEKAERHEVNLLISPMEGLTAEPERVTSIIKKVGGFRVGTFPDFETASRAADPVTYLRRLTPYAAAVCAATLEFVDAPEGDFVLPPPPKAEPRKSKKSAKAGAAPKEAETAGDAPSEPEVEAAPETGAKGKKGRSKPKSKAVAAEGDAGEEAAEPAKGAKSKVKASSPPPEPASDDDEDADEEELKKLGEEMGLVPDEDWAELEQMLEEIPPPPVHKPYSLDQLVAAVVSVGYDGTLAIDYRGKGDLTAGILNSRAALEAAIRVAHE